MELIKGTLDVLILQTVAAGPLHGYAISRAIRATSGEVLQVEEGALYPALRRLAKRGWLASRWGTTEHNRDAKFYELTELGQHELEKAVADWRGYVAAMERVLQSDQGDA